MIAWKVIFQTPTAKVSMFSVTPFHFCLWPSTWIQRCIPHSISTSKLVSKISGIQKWYPNFYPNFRDILSALRNIGIVLMTADSMRCIHKSKLDWCLKIWHLMMNMLEMLSIPSNLSFYSRNILFHTNSQRLRTNFIVWFQQIQMLYVVAQSFRIKSFTFET